MVEQAGFVHGGVSYPIPSAASSALLKEVDPALFYVIDYFKSVLTTYVEPRLVAQCAATGIARISKAVAETVPYDPAQYLFSQVFQFPLLAVWRKSEKERWRTIARMQDDGAWCVSYILPALSKLQMDAVYPILRSVSRVIANRLENKFDPAYQNGANFMALAGLSEMSLVSGAYGRYDMPDKDFNLPAWAGEFLVSERDGNMPVSATGGPLTGIDVDLQLDPCDGKPVVDHFIDQSITTT